jgi:integrase
MAMSKPRRGKGEGSVRKITLASGKVAWRAFLTVGYKPDGKGGKRPIRRTIQGRTQRAVLEGLERLKAKYRGGAVDFGAETGLRLHALLEQWLAHVQATRPLKKHTPDTYRWAIKHVQTFGDPLVAKVQPHELQTFLNSFAERFKLDSIKLIRVVIVGAFTQAKRWRVRPDNPAEDLELPYVAPTAERRVLSEDEGRRYLKALEGERLGLAVAFTYALAMRPGEAAAVKIAHVDLEAGTVHVEATHNHIVSTKRIERETPKSARGVRTLRLSPALLPWAARRIERARIERATMEGQWTAPDEGLLFVREKDGGRCDRRDVARVAKRVAERAGLAGVNPRILRRSMLSLLAAKGVDRKVRAAIGGHTEVVTETHYREVSAEEVEAALTLVDGMMEEE